MRQINYNNDICKFEFSEKDIDLHHNFFIITKKGYLINFQNNKNLNIDLSNFHHIYKEDSINKIFSLSEIIKMIIEEFDHVIFFNSNIKNGIFLYKNYSTLTIEQKNIIKKFINNNKEYIFELLEYNNMCHYSNSIIKK